MLRNKPTTETHQAYKRGKLEMISNQDKRICEFQRPKTGRKCDLRRLINYTIIELAAGE